MVPAHLQALRSLVQLRLAVQVQLEPSLAFLSFPCQGQARLAVARLGRPQLLQILQLAVEVLVALQCLLAAGAAVAVVRLSEILL